MAVGRGANTLRLFVTCVTSSNKNIIKLYDRNLNDELLEALAPNKTKKEVVPLDPNSNATAAGNATGKNNTTAPVNKTQQEKDILDKMKE